MNDAERGNESILTVARGFCMGAADIIPGVSGGTMAFILGIYERLVGAIRAFDARLLRLLLRGQLGAAVRHTDFPFLLCLLAGILAALLFFTRVVPLPALIHDHPEPIYSLFFGLIVASVVVLLRETPRLVPRDLLWLAAGAGLGFGVVNLVPVDTPDAAWFVFLSGLLAICAMILPGVSGAFILLVLNKYAYVLDALGRLELGVLVPFTLGAISGLVLFSRALTWLLHHHYRRTLLAISGLLVGSLWVIWPFQERTYEMVAGRPQMVASSPVWPAELDGSVLAAAALVALGLAMVLGLHALSERRMETS